MKNPIHPFLGLGCLLLLALFTTGCPVGITYPLCEADKVEKLDTRLLGNWKSLSDSAEILEVRLTKKDDVTFNVQVMEHSDNYLNDAFAYFSWTTKLDGHTFLFSQPAEGESSDYYLYHYAFEGKKLVLHDVGLLVGGVDAVTSTEAFRKEVSASLKDPDCLSARIEYVKQ
ncbi:MAG: hypothetical protein MUC59_00100 [Saprospiraceae bacterium]|nr:hypothetical protein [Saprospiraceae bacterium]